MMDVLFTPLTDVTRQGSLPHDIRHSTIYHGTGTESRYQDPNALPWSKKATRREQSVRMFTPRFLLFSIVFHVFDAGYGAIVIYYFYVIPKSVTKLQ